MALAFWGLISHKLSNISVKFKFIIMLGGCYLFQTSKVKIRPHNEKISLADRADICKEQAKYQPMIWLYSAFNTSFHLICSIYYLLFGMKVLDPTSQFYCYSPRPIYTRYLEPKNNLILGFLFSALIVGWRFVLRIWRGDFEIDVVSFLTNSERDYTDCLRFVGQKSKQKQKKLNSANHDRQSQPLAGQRSNYRSIEDGIDPMLELMYYKFHNPGTGSEELILRPNRRPEARKLLFESIDRKFNLALICSLLTSLSNCFLLLYWSIIEHLEVSQSAQCSSKQIADHMRVLSFLSQAIGSFFISLVYMNDGIPTFVFCLPCNSLLISDLNIYLNYIKCRVMKLKRHLAKNHHHLFDDHLQQLSNRRHQEFLQEHSNHQFAELDNQLYGYDHDRQNYYTDSEHRMRLESDEWTIIEIAKLHSCLSDFFDHVRRTDRYMSISVGFSMILWLGLNGMVTATGLQLETTQDSSQSVRVLQLAVFLLIWQVNRQILSFKSRVESIYVHLCSMMALDPTKTHSSGLKSQKWIQVMSFYTQRASYSFTLFGTTRIYSRLTFLSVISYTITFAFLVESFQWNEQQQQQ